MITSKVTTLGGVVRKYIVALGLLIVHYIIYHTDSEIVESAYFPFVIGILFFAVTIGWFLYTGIKGILELEGINSYVRGPMFVFGVFLALVYFVNVLRFVLFLLTFGA